MNYESFDTETLNRPGGGHAVLLLKSAGDSSEYWEFPASFSDIYGFLRGGTYTCFNMDFDARAIIHERFLPWQIIEKLALFGRASWEKFSFEYIPKKFQKVRGPYGSFTLYDVQSFFGTSLREACRLHLGAEYQKDEIPKSWYSEIDKCLKDNRREKILAYGLQDVRTTKALTNLLLSSYKSMGLEVKNLISPASIAKQYFGPKIKDHISILTARNLKFRNSLYGGRIETGVLGQTGPCTLYDIHSAYPDVMRRLPSLYGASWRESRENEWPGIAGVLYGSYDIDVDVPHDFIWGPLALADNGVCVYPVGRFSTTCGLAGLRALKRARINCRVKRAFEFIGKNKIRPFRDVEWMYPKRKLPGMGLALKLTMNSGFGILAEQVENSRENNTSWKSRDINGNFVKSVTRLGDFNCFPMAAAITEAVRVRIWETMQRFRSDFYMAATDSALLRSGGGLLEIGPNLGEWGLKGDYSDGVILGCGRYLLYKDGKRSERHLRGFSVTDQCFDLLEKCRRSKTKLPLFTAGSLRSWAISGCLGDLNVLEDVMRKFTIDDTKRVWDFNFDRICDAWQKRIDSRPFIGV